MGNLNIVRLLCAESFPLGNMETIENKSETTDGDLRRLCGAFRIPLRLICFKDELKYHEPRNGAYIINLDDSTSGREGTHWLAFFLTKNKAFFFDSFGLAEPKEITDFVKRHIIRSNQQIQSIQSGGCGSYCIDFLYHICRNPTENGYLEFLNIFKPLRIW